MNSIRYELRRLGRRAPPTALDSQASDDAPSPLDQAVGSQATSGTKRRWAGSDPEDREAIIARVEMGYSTSGLPRRLASRQPRRHERRRVGRCSGSPKK